MLVCVSSGSSSAVFPFSCRRRPVVVVWLSLAVDKKPARQQLATLVVSPVIVEVSAQQQSNVGVRSDG